MARFNLSFLAVFLVLAICAVSLPTKRGELLPTSELGLDKTIDELKVRSAPTSIFGSS
jgi:hypothetical protein